MGGDQAVVVTVLRLEEEAQRTTREISFRFVPEPSLDEAQRDALVGLKRYRNAVRPKARPRQVELKLSPPPTRANDYPPNDVDEGLGTHLRPNLGNGLNNDHLPVDPPVEA